MSTLPDKPFWMIYGIRQGFPTRTHESRHKAIGEMKRLARAHPGVAFVLLEAVGAAMKDDMKTVVFGQRHEAYLDEQAALDEEIPF